MEAIAGAADGVNAAGLAVSLAFGGRKVVGRGFGVPLIVRYLLEVCERTRDAVDVLRRIPSHMSYNLTILDREGDHATVFIAPDRPIEISRQPFATNHQGQVEWQEQARFSRTVERAAAIQRLLARPALTQEGLIDAFLRAPLYATDHVGGFGTVYTAAYRPADAALELRWPDEPPWRLSCTAFREGSRRVRYGGNQAAMPAAFAELLAECLRRPQAADWSRLGRFWAGGFPQIAG
jgi:predicted choloylglycine hydrolase